MNRIDNKWLPSLHITFSQPPPPLKDIQTHTEKKIVNNFTEFILGFSSAYFQLWPHKLKEFIDADGYVQSSHLPSTEWIYSMHDDAWFYSWNVCKLQRKVFAHPSTHLIIQCRLKHVVLFKQSTNPQKHCNIEAGDGRKEAPPGNIHFSIFHFTFNTRKTLFLITTFSKTSRTKPLVYLWKSFAYI